MKCLQIKQVTNLSAQFCHFEAGCDKNGQFLQAFAHTKDGFVFADELEGGAALAGEMAGQIDEGLVVGVFTGVGRF
jgi:hypothetical protein